MTPVDASKSLMPAWLPQFNKRVTNRIQGVYAPYVPPLAVVIHVGRRSGRVYTTPVAAFLYQGTVAIPLPYSAETQWVRNLLAADGGEMIRRGRRVAFTHPRILTEPPATSAVSASSSGSGASSSPGGSGQPDSDVPGLSPIAARALTRMPVLVADITPAAAPA